MSQEVMAYQNFLWRGEPILDIHEWARQRGEQMVKYDVWVTWFGSPERVYSHTEECPESFFGNMRFSEDYRNIRKYTP